MARKNLSLDEKIEKAKADVILAKTKYDAAVDALEALVTKKRELESKEILKAIAASNRSYDEIMAFLKGPN